MCPKADCAFTILLDDLADDQRDCVAHATTGIRQPFITVTEGKSASVSISVREVIDIIALAHYESTHVRHLGIRHVLHGQELSGRVSVL